MKPKKISTMAAPSLPTGNDAAVAKQLRALLDDAANGLRRILIAGFFIDRVASELPHGKFRPWLEAHCADVTWRTVFRWRELARGVAQAVGLGTTAEERHALEWHHILELPAAQVPEQARATRKLIDELIDGRSARQLLLDFKQVEENEVGEQFVKVGRRKGEGGKPPAASIGKQADLLKQLAHADWIPIERDLLWLYKAKFCALSDLDVTAQIACLEQAIFARKEWLRTLPEHRVSSAVEALFPTRR